MGSIKLTNKFDVLGKLEQHLSTVGQEPAASPASQPTEQVYKDDQSGTYLAPSPPVAAVWDV